MAANFGADVSSALPGYTLGRPLLPDLAAQIPEVEASVARLQALCLRQRASGGCLVVSAGPAGESFLYHSLAVLSSRLRRRGCSTHFPCIPFSSRLLPAPKEVSIVLDAPLRRWGDEWREPGPGMVTVLAGLDDHWRQLGIAPDVECPPRRSPFAEESFQRQIARWQQQFLAGGPDVRSALLSAAAGCDLPERAFAGGTVPAAASPVLDLFGNPTGFWSAHGLYLANTALRSIWMREDVRRMVGETSLRLAELLAGEPLVLERFGFGLSRIVSNLTFA